MNSLVIFNSCDDRIVKRTLSNKYSDVITDHVYQTDHMVTK